MGTMGPTLLAAVSQARDYLAAVDTAVADRTKAGKDVKLTDKEATIAHEKSAKAKAAAEAATAAQDKAQEEFDAAVENEPKVKEAAEEAAAKVEPAEAEYAAAEEAEKKEKDKKKKKDLKAALDEKKTLEMFFNDQSEQARLLLARLRDQLLACAASPQNEDSALPAQQMNQEVLRGKFTAQQQRLSRLDGELEDDGFNRRPFLEPTPDGTPRSG